MCFDEVEGLFGTRFSDRNKLPDTYAAMDIGQH